MKKLFFIAGFMVVGLFLQVGIGFARGNFADKGQNIVDAVNSFDSESYSKNWKPTGPTAEDIQAATKVKNLAAKGSLEDKLISAAKNGDLKNVETFIAAGAGLEARDNEDMTALMRAAEKGYTDIVSKLINAGANVHTGNKFGMTPLFMATDKNHSDTVKVLMTAGAASDRNFEDIFVSAVFKGNTKMVKALIDESGVISRDTLEAAMSVVSYGNTELVALLKNLLKKSE